MTAFRVLMRVQGEGGYSNIALSEALEASHSEPRDRAFITRLVYGVLEKTEYLDHVISSYVKTGSRIEPEVRCLLRMAVYQMVFMNTPDSAAVNESVNLAKRLKLFRATGFINGLLRSFIRDGREVRLPDRKKQPEKYSEYSEEQAAARAKIAEKYGFTDIRYAMFRRTRILSAAEYRLLIGTYSDHIAMEESVRERFFDAVAETISRYGGFISVFDTVDLQLARKP